MAKPTILAALHYPTLSPKIIWEETRVQLEKIEHVHISVKDLEKTVKFFAKDLDAKFTPLWPVE